MQKIPLGKNLLIIIIVLFISNLAIADVLDELDQQLKDTQQQLSTTVNDKTSTAKRLADLEKLKKQYEGTLGSIQNNYQLTRSQLDVTTDSLEQKNLEIENTNQELTQLETSIDQKYQTIYSAIRQIYMSQPVSWLDSFITINRYGHDVKNTFINRSITFALYNSLNELKIELAKITEIKEVLMQIQKELADQKSFLESQQRSLQNEIASTQQRITSAQSEMQKLVQALSGFDQAISSLTQKQRDILTAKAAAALASTSVGNIEINQSAIEKSPPADGNVYFSFWTYGYPHRVGMNQYGAFGRAKIGQNYSQILAAYYQGAQITDVTVPDSIVISTSNGNQSISFEDDYLMGIGEMPSCWGAADRGGMEALKAQAIAARTYAIYSTNNGQSSICTDQHCQVYVGSSKITGTCGQYWKQAVLETRGKILTYNGSPILAVYASTAGGYTLNSSEAQPYFSSYKPYLIGIKDADENGDYYDGPKHGDSPWFHKSWGDQPWLSISQVTDLFNAALLPETYNNDLTQTTSAEITARLIQSGIEPISDFNAIELIDQNGKSVNPASGPQSGQTAKVRVYYQNGKVAEVTASRFKFVFNLLSPGTDSIYSTRFDVLTAAEL